MGLFTHRKGLAKAKAFCETVHLALVNENVEQRLLRCYSISPELGDESALISFLEFGSDIGHEAASNAFVHGENPWEPYRVSKGTATLREGTRTFENQEKVGTKRYDELIKIGQEVGLDTLLGIWESVLFGN